MITKQRKSEMLEELKGEAKKAGLVLFVNFHGLTVNGATELRRVLKAVGAKYKVAKKTLVKKALEGMGIGGTLPELEGEVAMVTSTEDPTGVARVVHQFAKKSKLVKLIGGIFEKEFMSGDTATAFAMIPAREVLLGQFVNVINSPIQGLVVALSKIAEKKQ